MSLTIRPIEPSDRADWDRLWTAYLEFYETTRPQIVYDTTFARIVDPLSDQHGLLAVSDGTPVGLTHFLFHPNNWHVEKVCYLQDLYADPTVRGLGVGRALMEAVYAEADARGAPDFYWNTQEFNTTARRLYDRIGVATPFVKYRRGPRS